MAEKGGEQGAAKYVGVQLLGGLFTSIAQWNNRKHYAGFWPSEQEAAIARDRVMLHFQAPAHRLQLPELSLPLGGASPEELRRLARLRAHELSGAKTVATRRLASKRARPKGASPYVGVYFLRGSFQSVLSIRGTTHVLGSWLKAEEAAIARDRAMLHFGEPNKYLQLPERSEPLGPASPPELRRLARLRTRELSGLSPYIGVSRSPNGWRCGLGHVGVSGYATAEAAALAYDRLALHVMGSSAVLNFPLPPPRPASAEELRAERRTSRAQVPGGHALARQTKFRGEVRTGSTSIHAGYWPTKDEAIVARDRLLLYLGRPHVELQCPERSLALGGASSGELQRLARARSKQSRGSASGYNGVGQDVRGRWNACVRTTKRAYYVYGFADEEQAAVARDRLALFVLGKRARLNFPERTLQAASLQTLRREVDADKEERDDVTSRYRGVCLKAQKFNKPWLARVASKKKIYELGYWKTPEDAALAHDRAVLYFGVRRSQLNFPELAQQLGPADPSTLRAAARSPRNQGMRLPSVPAATAT